MSKYLRRGTRTSVCVGTKFSNAFVLCLVESGCHKNVAETIWKMYLNHFDRWMIIASKKYKTDKDFFENMLTTRTFKFVNEIVRHGYLEILCWARENGCHWNENTSALAAQYGHLEVLQWVRGNGGSWDARVCQYAAQNGNFEMLKWVRSCAGAGTGADACPWDKCASPFLAAGGHLQILQWARSFDGANSGTDVCPWDETTCALAAQNGHLDVLRWAREMGVLGTHVLAH